MKSIVVSASLLMFVACGAPDDSAHLNSVPEEASVSVAESLSEIGSAKALMVGDTLRAEVMVVQDGEGRIRLKLKAPRHFWIQEHSRSLPAKILDLGEGWEGHNLEGVQHFLGEFRVQSIRAHVDSPVEGGFPLFFAVVTVGPLPTAGSSRP